MTEETDLKHTVPLTQSSIDSRRIEIYPSTEIKQVEYVADRQSLIFTFQKLEQPVVRHEKRPLPPRPPGVPA